MRKINGTISTKKDEPKIKILIGTITYDSDWYCLKQFADSVDKLDKSNFSCDMLIIDNSDTENYMRQLDKFFPKIKTIYYKPPPELKGFSRFRHCEIHCRQLIVNYCIQKHFDYLFFLDSDVICNPDVVQKLLSHKKDIVCGLFRYRNPPEGRPLWFRYKTPPEISPKTDVPLMDFIPNHQLFNSLMEIDACGFGAILIKTEVLKRIPLRKSENDHYGADINFCADAKKRGYQIFGDPLANCNHLYKQCARRREDNANAF